MKIRLFEIAATQNSTASLLSIDGKPFCMVVEDGPRDKKVKHETRIPAGIYPVVQRTEGKFFNQYSKRFKHTFVPELLNVPGFTGILIHIGNFVSDTSGCLLVNRLVGLGADGNFSGMDSTTAYKILYNVLAMAFEDGKTVEIEVNRKTA